MTTPGAADRPLNVASRLTAVARSMPDAIAVVEPLGYDGFGDRRYRHVTFRELDDDSTRIARALQQLGVTPGTRLALLVPPRIDSIALVFALLKAGAVIILIDPGMGRRNLLRCLSEAEPEGFVAIPLVHAVRVLLRGRFPKARFHVTVGRRWFWGGTTLDELRARRADGSDVPARTGADDPAAIIFTTGSTGPPKGVLYTHGNFDAQVEEIRDFYGIRPGEIDLPCFPLFGLFNAAMGVTAVIPDMDPSRPAQADPEKIVEAIDDWSVTQAFGSPAIWARVGPYCRENGIRLATLRRVLSAGAPVPARVLQEMKDCIHPEGDVHTPYGATESLPVASIAASEVLADTAARTSRGAGVCVGRRFPRIQWRVVRIVDGPIPTFAEAQELPPGEIGELIVHGPVVTREYVTRRQANALGKIADGDRIWHRLGDAGYLDEQGRFWFCGRVAHRVLTQSGPMYTIPCEAIFSQHPWVRRSALVGVGPVGRQRPVIVVEPLAGRFPRTARTRQEFAAALEELGQSAPLTVAIRQILFHPAFPVDIRHNVKIFREKLALWAAARLIV
jgi:acyl-CoA synthetase (AMP-forming)/AMP-acid ligase II